ncbi:hypothetical protein [Crocosphaera sp.]|uniref:hypothetical protein n=1 Tax=Crocosphaera sp. TaxID=2729996 RepID=UPI003F273060|nr:methylmalonic aciduria and homocystinuria type D protein [Crocosphaera sp.]
MSKKKPLITYQTTIKFPIEIYIHTPTQFIIDHVTDLLPTWKSIPRSILIILLYAKIPIETISQETEEEKERLKQEFLQLAHRMKQISEQDNYFIEIIDPQEGKPINFNDTKMNFDIIAIVNQSLGFNYYNTEQGCKILHHPTQKTAIYPSLLVSDTDTVIIKNLLEKSLNNP